MKNLILATLMLVLAAGCNTKSKQENNNAEAEAATTEQALEPNTTGLAFVNVELVMSESKLYKSKGVALQEKTNKAQQSWARKEQNLQNDMAKLQEKYQKGLITTLNAQNEEQKLQKRAQEYQAAMQKEGQQLEEENRVFNNRMADLMNRSIQQINSDKRYKLVVNASALLDADPSLDISQEVLATLNALYDEDQKSNK